MIRIIAAVSRNGVIGKNGMMPWHVKEELAQFKALTTGGTVIMGRKTYQSIGKPLPDRNNIVISNTIHIRDENCVTVQSLEEALHTCESDENVWIIGGGALYRQAVHFCDEMYLSEMDVVMNDGDTWFPSFDEKDFTVETGEWHDASIPFRLKIYRRKR